MGQAFAVTGAVWDAVVTTRPAPPGWVVFGTAAAALVAVLDTSTWLRLRHVVTIAHEGGHAAVAVLSGRRLRGVRLHSDTSGLTLSAGRPTGPGMVATAAAGYLAPALLGLVAALALSAGYLLATLWAFLVLLATLLLTIRNVFGVVSIVGTAAVLVGVAIWAPPAGQAAFAYLLAWFLLLSAPRPVMELQRKRRRGQVRMSDADHLARLTGLPPVAWVGVFLLLTLGALAVGGWLLLHDQALPLPGALHLPFAG